MPRFLPEIGKQWYFVHQKDMTENWKSKQTIRDLKDGCLHRLHLNNHKSGSRRAALSAMLDPLGRVFVLIQVLYYHTRKLCFLGCQRGKNNVKTFPYLTDKNLHVIHFFRYTLLMLVKRCSLQKYILKS